MAFGILAPLGAAFQPSSAALHQSWSERSHCREQQRQYCQGRIHRKAHTVGQGGGADGQESAALCVEDQSHHVLKAAGSVGYDADEVG